ncbi:MAG: DUF5011 domain-containing protein [Bacilli bacterium]|nr:DUF5011 domain-containing protein [Bacilli bacterium]
MESGLKRLLIMIGVIIVATTIFSIVRSYRAKKKYNEQIKNLEIALEKWGAEYHEFLPDEKGESIVISLRTLKQAGYIDSKFVNPKEKMNFSNQLLMEIKKTDKGYQYTIFDKDKNMVEDYEEVKKQAPMIIMKGKHVEHAELNRLYEELGYDAITIEGKKPDEMKVEIVTEGKAVAHIDTSKARTYQLTYHVSYAKEESTITRIVIVSDKEKPTISMERLTVKPEEARNVNLMNGVVVSDNSNQDLTVEIEGALSSIPGRYVLTYRVIDPSSNVVEKKRVVRVEE